MHDFVEFIKDFKGKALILSHQNADADAVASSIALFEGLKGLNDKIQVELGAPRSVSKIGNQILESFGKGIEIDPDINAGLLILIDVSTLNQLAPLDIAINAADAKKAVIDHHAPHDDTKGMADFYIVDEDASSCAELIYRLLKEGELDVDEEIGKAILIGIIADTAHLKFASQDTLKVVNEILEKTGVTYDDVLTLLEMPEDISQKIAHLKAAQRLELYRVVDWVIVTSHVSAFGASAARALLSLGADIAFVASDTKDGIQVSSRATPEFLKKTGLHLGKDIMPKVGEMMSGSGGGHAGAAGAKGGGGVGEVLTECVKLVRDHLHAK